MTEWRPPPTVFVTLHLVALLRTPVGFTARQRTICLLLSRGFIS